MARRDCRHNPKKTETVGTFAVSGEGCPDRDDPEGAPARGRASIEPEPAVDEVLFDGAAFRTYRSGQRTTYPFSQVISRRFGRFSNNSIHLGVSEVAETGIWGKGHFP